VDLENGKGGVESGGGERGRRGEERVLIPSKNDSHSTVRQPPPTALEVSHRRVVVVQSAE
jgi:hypothetical protein